MQPYYLLYSCSITNWKETRELTTQPYVLSHSDIQSFLSCRNRWEFGSRNRLGYRPYTTARELDLGAAWASAMELYYEPITWASDHKRALSMGAFIRDCNTQREKIYRNTDMRRDLVDAEIEERIALGKGMLQYFFDWSAIHDDGLKPVAVEMEFDVPIKDAGGQPLTMKGRPVHFRLRIDRLIWDEVHGVYWLGEDKTAKQFNDADWLAIDPQTTRYMWALQEGKAIRVHGVLWTQFRKDFPEPPKINGNGAVSVDKTQCTTAAMFAEAVQSQHHKELGKGVAVSVDRLAEYGKMHEFLTRREALDASGEVPWLIRRIPQYISPEITEGIGWELAVMAQEMLNDPIIYPHKTAMNCQRCWAKEVCILRHEGQDWRWALDHNFEKREDV